MLARFILLAVLIMLIARMFWRFVDGILRGVSGPAPQGGAGSARAPVKMLPCPVCGTYVVPGKALSVVRGGNPVYFCSEKCRNEYHA